MNLTNKISKQRTGARSDIEFQKQFKTVAEAKKVYSKAKQHLLNVNNWHNIAGLFSGRFTLTDKEGNTVKCNAEKGLYFKINLHTPGMFGSDGYDWVKIEEVYEEVKEENEWIIIRVKPSEDPEKYSSTTMHFFTQEARSNFCVERKGRIVKACVYGRNEKPNVQSMNIYNRIRNWLIGKFATLGFNKPQWKGLVKGLVLK